VRPPATLEALSEPIYEAFFGLVEQPFAISTDPKFFFPGTGHHRAHEELLTGLQRREALFLVTGETGTGKTTLCRAALGALEHQTFFSILHNPHMLGTEMLRLIVRDFGLVSREELRQGAFATADASRLLEVIESFLRSVVPLGSHAVLVIDEAQNLSPAVLEEMRILTAFEHEGQQLLQIILCGQPRLLNTLKAETLTSLNERITRRVQLTPLDATEVDAYIRHRLGVAGAGDVVVFEAEASELVANLSRGLPRRVNVLCDRALQEGRIAGEGNITRKLVKRAARALAGAPRDTSGDEDGTAVESPFIDRPVGVSRFGVWLRQHVLGIFGWFVCLLLAGGALGYGYYARSVLNQNPAVPEPPAVPGLKHEPALSRPAPAAADIDAIQPSKMPE
jgi:general secretion pathway protein A